MLWKQRGVCASTGWVASGGMNPQSQGAFCEWTKERREEADFPWGWGAECLAIFFLLWTPLALLSRRELFPWKTVFSPLSLFLLACGYRHSCRARQTFMLHWLNPRGVGGRRHPACWSNFPICQAVASQGCGVRAVGVALGGYPFHYVVVSLLDQSWQKCNLKSTSTGSSASRVKAAWEHLWPKSLPHIEKTAVCTMARELLLAVLLSGCTCFWALPRQRSNIPFLIANF